MGRFFADVHSLIRRGQSLDEVMPDLMAITGRHGVTVAAPAVNS